MELLSKNGYFSITSLFLILSVFLSGCTSRVSTSSNYPQSTAGLVSCLAASEQTGSMPEGLETLLNLDGLLMYTESFNWLVLKDEDTFLQTQIQNRDGLEIRTYTLQQGNEELFFALSKEPFNNWVLSLDPQEKSVVSTPAQRWMEAVLETAFPGAEDEAALADPDSWQKTATGYVYSAGEWIWEVSLACGIPACITTVFPDGRTQSVMIRRVSNAPDLISEARQAVSSLERHAVGIQDPIPLPMPSAKS